ncbi:MAG: M28 family peptidase [Clostridia bacterium]|nr:M28 family peptidase [Clostridia bacterium]
MKKFFKFLVVALAVMLPALFVVIPVHHANAISIEDSLKFSAYSHLLSFVDDGLTERRIARMAGSDGEHDAKDRIQDALEVIGTNVTAVNNATTIDGIQRFGFYNYTNDRKEVSYNIIYKIAGRSSQKKIVLTCNYDNYYAPYVEHYKKDTNPLTNIYVKESEQKSEGINASAASVGIMLALADFVEEGTLDFDVELVFFGAGYQGNAGAKHYVQTLSKADREATLLLVDISRIAFGSEIYYYSGEFGSNADKFFDNNLSTLKRFKSGFYGSSVNAGTPLGYTNAGYSDSTIAFADSGLNFLHIFAGSYGSGVVGGNCEYYGKQNVINTSKDSLSYISDQELVSNLGKASAAVYNFLNSENMVQNLSTNPNMTAYNVFTNTYVATWLPVFILIVLLLITVIVHYLIASKTFKYATDHNITGVMITIDQDDEDDTEE